MPQREISAGFTHIAVYIIFNGIPAVPPSLVFNRGQTVYLCQTLVIEPPGKKPAQYCPPEGKNQQANRTSPSYKIALLKIGKNRVRK